MRCGRVPVASAARECDLPVAPLSRPRRVPVASRARSGRFRCEKAHDTVNFGPVASPARPRCGRTAGAYSSRGAAKLDQLPEPIRADTEAALAAAELGSAQSMAPRPRASRKALAREKGRDPRNPPCADSGDGWAERITRSPAVVSAKRAFQMAGLNPSDMDFAEIYDCYTITVMITLEDAGFMPKGESGPGYAEHDTTYKGDFPVNTHGGQLSYGQQAGNTGGFSQVMEATLQLQGRAGERQVERNRVGFVNG